MVSLVLKLRGSAVGEEVVMGDGAERERRAGLPSTRSFTFPLLNAFSFLLTDVRPLLSRECPYPPSRLLFALLSTCRQPADPCVTSVFSCTCCRHLSLSYSTKVHTHTHQKITCLSLSDGVCLSVPASLGGTTLTTFYGASSLNNDENFPFILFF